jgi:hypothetical protein
MREDDSGKTSRRARRFGSFGGWLLIAYFTVGSLFMLSGVMVHGVEQPGHPAAGHAGWIFGGLAPAIGYLCYHLLARAEVGGHRRWLRAVLAVAIFFACQIAGLSLLAYAVGQ